MDEPSSPGMDEPSSPALELGQRLKRVRELNGLSRRELARRAGVTNSNVSMIEQGLVSPSISSLTRLLEVFPLSLAHFFGCDPDRNDQFIYRTPHPLSSCSQPGIHFETFPDPLEGHSLSMSRYRLAGGSDTGPEYRVEHKVLAGWLLEGELELSLGARVTGLTAGDGFYLPAGQPYRVRNLSEADAWVIVARTGAAAT